MSFWRCLTTICNFLFFAAVCSSSSYFMHCIVGEYKKLWCSLVCVLMGIINSFSLFTLFILKTSLEVVCSMGFGHCLYCLNAGKMYCLLSNLISTICFGCSVFRLNVHSADSPPPSHPPADSYTSTHYEDAEDSYLSFCGR